MASAQKATAGYQWIVRNAKANTDQVNQMARATAERSNADRSIRRVLNASFAQVRDGSSALVSHSEVKTDRLAGIAAGKRDANTTAEKPGESAVLEVGSARDVVFRIAFERRRGPEQKLAEAGHEIGPDGASRQRHFRTKRESGDRVRRRFANQNAIADYRRKRHASGFMSILDA